MQPKTTFMKSTRKYLFVIPTLLGIIFFYAWLVSAGSEADQGTTTHYYADLAEAFLAGNLHLTLQPDPHLLALENPYSLLARIDLTRSGINIPVDVSLYEGNFYLYWGPVPAVLLAAIKFFSGQQLIGDFFLAFAFGIGIFLTQSFLILAIWDRFFSTLPKWALHLSILSAGLAWPIALLRHEYDHARVYEAAIAGGQFFLMGGLLMAFTAIARPSISNWKLALAGFLWALAIGSRHILIAPICLMVALTALWIIRANAGSSAKAAKLVWLGLPFVAVGAGLAWYNWARFDSLTETGFSYALAGVDLQEHAGELFSGSYIIQNLYNYLLNPPRFTSAFPFVSILKGSQTSTLTFYKVPNFYYAQSITGLFFMFPFGVFGFVPPMILLKRSFQRKLLEDNEQGLLAWIALILSSAFLTAFFTLTIFFWAGIRYAGDFIPVLTVLSALGFWQGYRFAEQNPLIKRLYALFGSMLAIASILVSTLLVISTNLGLTNLLVRSFPFLK